MIAEIIALARHLTDKDAKMHDGVWDKSAKGAHEVRGRTLGIVGYGNIGSQLSVVAESIGMRVYFYDVADKLVLGNAQRCETLDELLEVAETVTLHVDGRPGNAGLFGAEQFADAAGAVYSSTCVAVLLLIMRRYGSTCSADISPVPRWTSSLMSPRAPETGSTTACKAFPT